MLDFCGWGDGIFFCHVSSWGKPLHPIVKGGIPLPIPLGHVATLFPLALSTAGVAKSAEGKAEFLRFDCYILGLNFVECRPKDRPTLRSSSVGIPCLRSPCINTE